MDTSLSPELREEVTSLIRSVVDRALDGQPKNGRVNRPADSEACTVALTNVCTSVSDAVQSTLRTYLRAHNNNKPLNTLPPEVLCAVFEYLAFPGRWAASCVCQHWRRIAIGHALLWSEHVVRHVSDGALQFSRSVLARTGRVPLDVDITFRQPGVRVPPSATLALTGFAETLLEHLHHTRSLTAHIELLPALSYAPSVLLNPAPLLTTLELAVSDSLIGASLCLPAKLFARDAPLLERAVLHRLQIPRGWTPPFSALQSLAITFFGDVDSDSVLRLVESAPRLRRLALALGYGDGGFPTWTSDVAFRTGIETLYVQAGVPFREEELLRFVHFFLEGNAVSEVGLCAPAERELDWLLARCEGCETLALVTRTGYAFALTSESSSTTTRAWQLRLRDLPAILDRQSLFTRLRALTLAEAAWCEPLCAARPRMPPAPRLERLTLVLATEREYFDEAHSWCGTFTGLFLLDVASAEMSDSDDEYVLQPWECPSLRTLRMMSAAEGGARVAEEDVRRVLERHLYAPALQRLEMLRVELYNPTTLLHGYVEEVVYLPDEEFDRVWPGLFPDLEWAGAVGMQECMTAAV